MNHRRTINRINSLNGSINNRPKSSFKSSSFLCIKSNIRPISVNTPTRLLTKPSNKSKQLKGMGNTFEREELYQLNQELKSKVNTLKAELYEAKSQITKKEREIKRKEKIIEDCYKEIHNPTSSYQKSLDKAKESTLLSLCKEQYNITKKENEQLKEEIKLLEMNIKITNIKEYKILINTLKNEMKKLTSLYKSAVYENNILKNKINDLMEYKKKFSEQHNVIDKCVKKVNEYNHNLLELELVNEELQNELNKKKKKTQFFKSQNNKLKLSKEKILNERKIKDYFNMYNFDNATKIAKLQKELDEYKRLYNLREQQIKKYEQNIEHKNRNKIEESKEFDFNKIINIEKGPSDESEKDNKIMLLKSLLEEKQKNIEILNSFIISQNLNPELVLQRNSIITNSNQNTNNLNNMSDSQALKNNISLKNLKRVNKNNNKNDTNSSNKNEKIENNQNSNFNSVNSNKNINLKNNENGENNSQLYNAAVINSNENEIDNNSEEQMKESEITSNYNEFNK